MLPFWIALQFLSSLPIRLPGMPQPQELGRSLLFYPVVGLLFGVLLWGLNSVLMGAPLLLHAALLLTAWVLLSGGLHLDGLADSADAWLGGFGDRERTLTIMKDPRSGPIAVVTLGMVLLLKFTALVALIEQPNGAALILAPLIGRASMFRWRTPGRSRDGVTVPRSTTSNCASNCRAKTLMAAPPLTKLCSICPVTS
jgi:adenosylcobinamide-GDP ribazoletransferase